MPGLARALASLAAVFALCAVGLPASAEPQSDTVEGTLVDVVIESDGHGEADEAQVIVSEDGEVAEVEGEALEDIESGSTVSAEVEGSEVQSATVVAAAEETTAVAAHHAYVVTISDTSTTGSVALADAVANAEYAADYWVTEARGAISSFDVADSTTLAWDGSCSANYQSLWTAAAAEFPGVSFSSTGNHLIVYTPEGCYTSGYYPYAGIAMVGPSLHYGGTVQIAKLGPATVVHELGHNLGLGHSFLTWDSGSAEYFGVYGPQALSVSTFPAGGLDAAYRYDLGLPGSSAQTQELQVDDAASETTVVTIDQTTATGGTNAVRLVDPSDGSEYFLEYRSGRGVDSSAFYSYFGYYLNAYSHAMRYETGVVVSRTHEPGLSDNEIEILGVEDGTTLWSSFEDGETYSAGDLFTMTVLSTTSTTATLQIVTNPTATGEPVDEPAKTATSVRANARSAAYGKSVRVTVAVSGTEGDGGDVTVTDGASTWTQGVDGDGKATFWMPRSWEPGVRTLSVTYEGTSTREASSTTVEARTTKAKAKIKVKVASSSAVSKGERSTFAVTVAGPYRASEAGKVAVFVNGKRVSRWVSLHRSGTVYRARVTSRALPKGRVTIKYASRNDFLGSRAQSTRFRAR
ncbi:hypothetical protein [Demequina salsinemoris]|uniref:hypothetical protein n=1 Tax=Demequina salsinemoris TaxID=577470 RepID=UPI0007804B59|nr:hypothetical protein [Demequina salsinemoris]